MSEPAPPLRAHGSLGGLIANLADIVDPGERRAARAELIEQVLFLRGSARRLQTRARLADAVAKLGGGSLLTATVLLIIGGQAAPSILMTAGLALLLLVAGTILWTYSDLQAAYRDLDADRLEAALKEAER